MFDTDNMALVAFLQMRGYNPQNMTHELSDVVWRFKRDKMLDGLIEQFNSTAVSVNLPAFLKLFGSVRDQMFAYLDEHGMRR